MQSIVLASTNKHKLEELGAMLDNYSVLPQNTFNVPEAFENGSTFAENSLIKAQNAHNHTRMAVIADDSGLVVPALAGEPGLYSSRFAGPCATDMENCDKLLKHMQNLSNEQRQAYFYCVITYITRDSVVHQFSGKMDGSIIKVPKATRGFGYDPIFTAKGYTTTIAKMPFEDKNLISHRFKALTQLKQLLCPTA